MLREGMDEQHNRKRPMVKMRDFIISSVYTTRDFLQTQVRKLGRPYKTRDIYKNDTEAFFALVGFSIGLGNLWRFSYMSHNHGGVTFLIPYGVCLVCLGVPLYLLELALGQYVSLGPTHVFAFMCPLLSGVGWGVVLMLLLVTIYYNVVMSWSIYYIVMSFTTSTLPWSHCVNLTNTYCKNDDIEKSMNSATTFFYQVVMGGNEENEVKFDINWPLVGCLGCSSAMLVACLAGGIRNTGKVLYITVLYPYFMLICLFVIGNKDSNSDKGWWAELVESLDLSLLAKFDIWQAAAGQVFYSLGTGNGAITTISSYNPLNHNLFRDGFLVCLLDTFTSLLCGHVFFSLTSDLPKETWQDSDGATTLVFTASSGLLARMDSSLWAVLFFTMIFVLGFNSQLMMVEAVTTTIFDQFSCLRRVRLTVVGLTCGALFLLAIPICARGKLGLTIFNFMDRYTASHSFILFSILQVVIAGYIFGYAKLVERMRTEMKQWIPAPLYGYLYITWLCILPISLLLLFGWSMWREYRDYLVAVSDHLGFDTFTWGQILAFTPALLLPVLAIHAYLIRGDKSVRELLSATENFRPEFRRAENEANRGTQMAPSNIYTISNTEV